MSMASCLGVVRNDSVFPIEKPEYGCLGSDVDFSNCDIRHVSLNRFPSYSELTASNSRSVDDAANNGEMKNCSKLNVNYSQIEVLCCFWKIRSLTYTSSASGNRLGLISK